MNWKGFIIGLSIAAFVVGMLVLFLDSIVNPDDPSHDSSFDLIDAKSIKERSESFVVVVIADYCPGASNYMPDLKKAIPKIKEKGYDIYIAHYGNISNRDDRRLTKFIDEHQIKEKVYIISHHTYGRYGGLFSPKNRYKKFVYDLYETPKNATFGYAYYMVFKDGKYYADTYDLEEVEL